MPLFQRHIFLAGKIRPQAIQEARAGLRPCLQTFYKRNIHVPPNQTIQS